MNLKNKQINSYIKNGYILVKSLLPKKLCLEAKKKKL